MAEPLAILQLGHPLLRQVAAPILDPEAPEIQQLINRLVQTLQASHGVGIAAPQVAESCQLLVVASHPNPRYPQAPEMEPLPMINPKIVAHNDEQVMGWEGCLSVPGLRGLVPRYTEVEVEFCDGRRPPFGHRNGQVKRQVFQDFVARIFQHEFDHLTGKVFVDRLVSWQDLVTEQSFATGLTATYSSLPSLSADS